MKIGVISDTHGYWDPAIATHFAGVEHILHAGDVGPWTIILQLERIAPVTAVIGNTDTFLQLREIEVVTLGGKKFLVDHIVDPHKSTDVLARRIEIEKPDVIVFGHTHKPHNEVVDGRLYFNPGYAGHKRFNLPRSLAVLELNNGKISHTYFDLA